MQWESLFSLLRGSSLVGAPSAPAPQSRLTPEGDAGAGHSPCQGSLCEVCREHRHRWLGCHGRYSNIQKRVRRNASFISDSQLTAPDPSLPPSSGWRSLLLTLTLLPALPPTETKGKAVKNIFSNSCLWTVASFSCWVLLPCFFFSFNPAQW